LLPVVWLNEGRFKELRLFLLFIFLGFLFYSVVGNFSHGAIDKYLMFMILPFSIIAGVSISDVLDGEMNLTRFGKYFVVLGSLFLGLGIWLMQFLNHSVPFLYPKEEWISRILHVKWNFVFPFTGGSGPVGFYVSWLFMALFWVIALVFGFITFRKETFRKPIAIVLVVFGIIYNLTMIEEYEFGAINGNPNKLLSSALTFIEKNSNIDKVITYNDIGGHELELIGKYERRLFAAPKFEANYVDILKNFEGQYLVIDIPLISPASPYSKFFSGCNTIYQDFSGKISAKVYDCNNRIKI
jgi:hypothetical protein